MLGVYARQTFCTVLITRRFLQREGENNTTIKHLINWHTSQRMT